LPRTILTRTWKARLRLLPQLRDRARFADQHSRGRPSDIAGERTAAVTRRNNVDPHVTERQKLSALSSRDETPEPSPRDVFEEDSFNRILGAETEDLLPLRLDELPGQVRKL
jgi:hypothetical protein